MQNRSKRCHWKKFVLAGMLFLAGTLQSEASTKQEFLDAVKKAGVSVSPSCLTFADDSITLHLPASMGSKKLAFKGSLDTDALVDGEFIFKSSEDNNIHWNDAFGMSFLDLKYLQLGLEIKNGATDISLISKISADFGKDQKRSSHSRYISHRRRGSSGSHKRSSKHSSTKEIEVDVELHVEDKKISDFSISLPDTTLSLHSFSEFRQIPGVSTFSLKSPIISHNAMGGTLSFAGETVDTTIFYDSKKRGWNLALAFEKAMTLGQLTGHKKGFLNHLGLPKMKMIMATKGINMAYSDLPLATQSFFRVDGALPDGDLKVKRGVNVIAQFDPALAPESIKKPLKTLGLDSTTLEIDGVVEGMFGGSPAVELTVDIDTPGNHGFPFLKTKDAKSEFFIKLSKAEADLGFRLAVLLSQGKHGGDLELDVDFGMKETEGEVEAFVAGGMQGDWHNAAGIKGLTIENPFMSVGINETGSFDMLIDGTVMVGSEKVRAAADMVLSPEALGLPTAFAFAGEINKLDFNDLVRLAKKHAKQKGGGLKTKDVILKDVAFAFLTPGATLPADLEAELSIEGSGMALKASLYIGKKELGSAKGYASSEGLSFDGVLDPFKLGPLNLKEAELEIEAGPHVDPKFVMSGDIVLFKGFEDKYLIDIEPEHFKFVTDTKFGGAFDVHLEAESDGLKVSSDNDFTFDAELSANYNKAFQKLVEESLKGLKKADKDMSKAKRDLKNATNKVKSLNGKIKSEKAKAKAAYDHAVKKINAAKNKVNKLKKTIAYNKKKAHDLDKKAKSNAKHLKFGKAAKEGTEEAAVKTAIAAEESALKTANWALNTAKKTVKIVPVDLAPKVVALTAELKTAEAGLKIAKGAVSTAKSVNKGVEDALKAMSKGLTAFKLNRIGVSGSLKGITSGGKHGKKPVLVIDVTIHGSHHVYRESIVSVKHEFEKLAKEIAKEAAKEILKAFEK
ncbi:MAG: hypothetical protein GY697_06680 [Desulfobacterales bacterium]|nr:hypothetical protein [Desulfobacterales bacterium]